MKRFAAFAFALLSLCGPVPRAVVAESLGDETTRFLALQNGMVGDIILSYATLKNPIPLFFFAKEGSFAADLSYAGVVAPFFRYRLSGTPFSVYRDFGAIYGSGAESVLAPNLSLIRSFGRFLSVGFNGSWLPSVTAFGAERESWRAAALAAFNFRGADFRTAGVSALVGYAATGGAIRRSLQLSVADTGLAGGFSGRLETTWAANALEAGLFLRKTSFFVNAYMGTTAVLLWGDRSSTMRGDVNSSLSDTSPLWGLSVQGGLEIDFGHVKLDVEGSADLLRNSYSGDAGVKVEL
ncbi:MAG TPA: hypothetical protein VMV83_02600 [Rectinemataceae bacterium]|nr:hypothetical protein [Rectinemataceae bacterium]